GADVKTLLTPINYVRSIDCYIPKIIHNFLALQALTHTPCKTVGRQPDGTGFIQSIGISNASNDHRRNALWIHWLVLCIIKVLIHLIANKKARFQLASYG